MDGLQDWNVFGEGNYRTLKGSSVYWFGYPFQLGSKLTKNTNLLIFKITCQKH